MPSDLKDRLAEALARTGKSKIELARFCGVSHPSVSNWFNGKTKELSAGNALRAALFLGVSVEWLTTGKGSMESNVSGLHEDDPVPDGFVSVPEIRVEFGAGSRFGPTYEEITESKPALYRLEWFLAHGTRPERCKRFKVHGDSMVPILFDGDTILCECSEQKIVSGKIYAFGFGDEMRVKRLFSRMNGGLLVVSENKSVPDETIEPHEMDKFYLIGKVIDRSGDGPF